MNHADVQAPATVDGSHVYAKISRRLIPYIFILYILAYLDRVNVGFAALEFRRDLHLTESAFGLGGGIYFLGQLLFDLPSNLMLGKVGPRKWIARIMISWGIIATCMMLCRGPHSFYALRLLLGISEAGFFPGMILYLTYWFPSPQRAKAVAMFMTATSIAGVVGAPLSAALLKLEGVAGLHGWQWLFLVEGAPTVLMGISVLWFLKDHPDDAAWLSEDEKKWLDAELEKDRQSGGAGQHEKLGDAFRMPMVWLLAVLFLLDQIGVYTLNLWMPSMLHAMRAGADTALTPGAASQIACFTMWPYVAAAIGTVLIGWSSDKTGERRGHIALCLLLSAAGLAWAAHSHSFTGALLAFAVATIGYFSIMGPFWALPTRVLGGQAAAGGVAVITMIGSLGGFLGPAVTGKLKDVTHGFAGGLYAVAASAILGALLCALLPGTSRSSAPAEP